ncbi:MAG TPA: HXXEE domain-containing protein [Gemmatimonadales bacterium]|nr:HXXEE domain-containing protein [Gemmatimonadales bacterium]
MMPPPRDRLDRGLLMAPLVFVAHFLEESPGFVSWFNAHVERGITPYLFWTVNITALAITLFVVFACRASDSRATVLVAVAWLSFLMLANAIFHVTGAIVDRGYVPGLVTAVVLYLPYYGWIARRVQRDRGVAPGWVAAAAVAGAIPMAVHGYRILFLGSRLF